MWSVAGRAGRLRLAEIPRRRTGVTRVVTAAVGGTLAVVVLLFAAAAGAVSGMFGGGGAAGAGPAGLGAVCLPADAGATSPAQADPLGLDAQQWGNAAVIVQVGRSMKVPPYGWVVAVATALQESDLVNLGDLGANNDHDSLGLFQQRPSQGWGTPAQVMDPVYASGKFYAALLDVPDWQQLPVTEAAQRVQKSAYPDAYAKHAARASAIVQALSGTCVPVGGSGWVAPVVAPIVSGYRTPDRPSHDGVDLGAPRGTPIRAAAAGIVVTVTCNATTAGGAPYSCDQDGSLSVSGCGWYVEILHADQVVTRYCHQLRAPMVHVGQTVAAGQIIGVVGASGNVTGPHLHYEVHLGNPATHENADEPDRIHADARSRPRKPEMRRHAESVDGASSSYASAPPVSMK